MGGPALAVFFSRRSMPRSPSLIRSRQGFCISRLGRSGKLEYHTFSKSASASVHLPAQASKVSNKQAHLPLQWYRLSLFKKLKSTAKNKKDHNLKVRIQNPRLLMACEGENLGHHIVLRLDWYRKVPISSYSL